MANQVLTKDTTPTLDFSNITGALAYWVQVATDRRFLSPTEQNAALAESTHTVGTALTDARKYYWRFRGRTGSDHNNDVAQTAGDASGIALRDNIARSGLGQSFVPLRSLPISRVTLSLKRVGTVSNNVWIEIYASSGGSPLAQLGTDSGTVAVSTIGTGAFEDITFDFSAPIALAAGTTYIVVLRGDFTVNVSNHCEWEHSGSNSYSNGAPFKESDVPAWTSNGNEDHTFTTHYQDWGPWSEVWSFWVDSTAEAAVTPTGWTFVDPTETTDIYTWELIPQYKILDRNVIAAQDENLLGDILSEYRTNRAKITCDFERTMPGFAQRNEIMRFYEKRKEVYLITLQNNGQDVVENIYKIIFAAEPDLGPIDGREDYYRGQMELLEAELT